MKINPYILFVVVVAAVLLSLKFNNDSMKPNLVENNTFSDNNGQSIQSSNTDYNGSSGLTPEYFVKFFSENGFTTSPVFTGKTTDIYTGKINVGNTNIEFRIDIYYERSSKEILLVEGNIDGSYYVNNVNEKEVEELVNKVANNYFVTLASLPYITSTPKEATDWIKPHIIDSYSIEPKEITSKEFGLATINIYGNPLIRTLEIDFGFLK